jgi:arylsulfatase A-like enzyme
MPAPRNVLMIVADQFRADVLQGALAAHVPTPNLDALAAESLRYENHHTVVVPCGPSRASLLTGLYAMTHGSVHNGAPLPRHFPTLATELRKLGHEPLLFGYTDTQPDPTGLAPRDPARMSYTGAAPGFVEVQEMREEAWAWLAHLRGKGYDVPDAGAPDFDRLYRPTGGIPGAPALYRAEDSDTAFLTDRTLAELDVRKARPWAALITYIRPHPPYVAPAPYHDMIDPEGLPAAAKAFDHPFFDAFHSAPSQAGMFWGFDGDQTALHKAEIARTRATYLGLVAELDHHIGRLLSWLEDTGQRENTLVVFTADHGEMLGDLGLWGKQTPFRQASHIPLMIRAPGQAPGLIRRPTRSIDLVPTLLARLGGASRMMDGGDLAVAPHRPAAMVELELGDLSGRGRFETFTDRPAQECRAVAYEQDQWRYVHFTCGFAPMLFDVANDPACGVNLIADHPDRARSMMQALLEHRITQASPAPYRLAGQ